MVILAAYGRDHGAKELAPRCRDITILLPTISRLQGYRLVFAGKLPCQRHRTDGQTPPFTVPTVNTGFNDKRWCRNGIKLEANRYA